MIDTLHFLNQSYFWPFVVLGVSVWFLFVWKEWSSNLKPTFYLHSLIALFCIVSLVMLALKPLVWSDKKTNTGILLTKNYKKERLDSLQKLNKNAKVISYKKNNPLGSTLDSVSNLFVLGNGVQSYDFWQFENIPTTYLGTEIPNGITKLNYQQELAIGDEMIVRGNYNAPQKGHRLIFADPGGKELDSVLLNSDLSSDFKLAAKLKVKGKFIYKILEKDTFGKVLTTQLLPIKVKAREMSKILMVNSFPTFELKYLKNFLAEVGYELVVRSQLTQGKFKFEYFNTKRNPFYSFSEAELESFDLLIVDANSYVNFSKKSSLSIEEAVKRSGLGILVLPDDTYFKLSKKTSKFDFLKQKSSKIDLKKWFGVSWEKYPYVFKGDIRLEEIHSSDEMILSGYHRNARGRIGTTVLHNTYQLLLNGNSKEYGQFWSEIISRLSKRRETSVEWRTATQFAFKDEACNFEIGTTDLNMTVIGENGNIPLLQHTTVPELWSGRTYPRKVGWHRLKTKNDSTSTMDFYVMDSLQWKTLTAYNTIFENKRKFISKVDVVGEKKVRTPIRSFWFYLIFVLGMGYLWFAPKLVKN